MGVIEKMVWKITIIQRKAACILQAAAVCLLNFVFPMTIDAHV